MGSLYFLFRGKEGWETVRRGHELAEDLPQFDLKFSGYFIKSMFFPDNFLLSENDHARVEVEKLREIGPCFSNVAQHRLPLLIELAAIENEMVKGFRTPQCAVSACFQS